MPSAAGTTIKYKTMKRKFIILASLVFMLSAVCEEFAASASERFSAISGHYYDYVQDSTGLHVVSAADTTEIGLAEPDSLMHLKSENGDLRLEVAGFGITLASSSRTITTDLQDRTSKYRKKQVSVTGFQSIDVGWLVLTDKNYLGSWSGHGDFLSLDNKNSVHFGMDIIGLDVNIGRKSRWSFNTALRFTADNYRFSNKVTLIKNQSGYLMPQDLPSDVRKSKVTATYMGLPVRFSYMPVKDLKFTAEASANVLLRAHTKYKSPKTKANVPGFNSFMATVGGSITYDGFGAFCSYSFTPLFDRGSDAKAFTIGIRLMF